MFDQSTKQEEIFENVAHGVIDKYIICLCFSFVTYGSFFILKLILPPLQNNIAVLRATMVPSSHTDRYISLS